jgi:hypothetical protein
MKCTRFVVYQEKSLKFNNEFLITFNISDNQINTFGKDRFFMIIKCNLSPKDSDDDSF